MAVYLDHAATTRIAPEVRALMVELLRVEGNPAAAHACGRAAKAILERARVEAADALGVSSREVVFTGSATEALDIGIGDLDLAPDVVVATSPIEHPAVLDALAGRPIVELPLDGEGRVAIGSAREILRDLGPRLGALVVTGAASETGVIQPVGRLAHIARSVAAKAVVVSDLVALAPLGLDAGSPARRMLEVVDVAVVAPHKLGGPTGVGVLVVREGTPLAPRRRYVGQERGLRGGTQAVWLAGVRHAPSALRLPRARHGARPSSRDVNGSSKRSWRRFPLPRWQARVLRVSGSAWWPSLGLARRNSRCSSTPKACACRWGRPVERVLPSHPPRCWRWGGTSPRRDRSYG